MCIKERRDRERSSVRKVLLIREGMIVFTLYRLMISSYSAQYSEYGSVVKDTVAIVMCLWSSLSEDYADGVLQVQLMIHLSSFLVIIVHKGKTSFHVSQLFLPLHLQMIC